MGTAAWMARSDSMVGMNPKAEILYDNFLAVQQSLAYRTERLRTKDWSGFCAVPNNGPAQVQMAGSRHL